MFKGRMLWAWQGWAMMEGRRWGFSWRHPPLCCPALVMGKKYP